MVQNTKTIKKVNLKPKVRCPKCKALYWRKHKCLKEKTKQEKLKELSK